MRALLSLLALSLSTPAVAEPRRFAIVMGANHGDRLEQPLLFAERDAERFGAVLSDLADVNEEDIVVLRGASRAQLQRVIRSVSERAEAAGPGSLLFFYYSGHADPTSLHLGDERLGFEELTQTLDAMPVDVRVLVIDACRSGSLTRLKGGVPSEPFEISVRDAMASEGTAIITSSSASEDSQESDRLRGGVFTHHFIGGLLGAADTSSDGLITLTEAYRYSYAQTLRSTSRARVIQHPSYRFELRGEDDIVITNLKEAARTGSLRFERGGEFVLLEDRRGGEVVAEVSLPDRAQLSLPAGDYLVRRRNLNTVQEGKVRVRVGEVQRVGEDTLTLRPYGQTVRKGGALEQRGVWAGLVSPGLTGPLLRAQSAQGRLAVGARRDGPQASLVLRGLWSRNVGASVSAREQSLAVHQDVVGLDAALLKVFDGDVLSPGIGVRVGVDGVQQRFETLGDAPTRNALLFRGGSVLRVERPMSARGLLSVELGVDFIAYRGLDDSGQPQLQSRVLPTLGLEVSRYVKTPI